MNLMKNNLSQSHSKEIMQLDGNTSLVESFEEAQHSLSNKNSSNLIRRIQAPSSKKLAHEY